MSTPGAPMLSAQISAIKGHQLSADKRELSIVLDAKHVGDLAIVLSTDQLQQLASMISSVKTELPATDPKDQLQISAPKTWLVTADLKIHDVVLVIFNRQTAAQSGYALDANAAKQMAEGLIKNADAVLKKKART